MECWMAERSSGRGRWKVGAGGCAAVLRVGDGAAGGVVVVAELFLAEAGVPQRWPSVKMWRHWKRFGSGMVVHPSLGFWCQSLRTRWFRSGLAVRTLRVKCEDPAFGRVLVFFCLVLL